MSKPYTLTRLQMSINNKGFRLTETVHKLKTEHPNNYAVYIASTGSGHEDDRKVQCIEKNIIDQPTKQAQYFNYVSCFMWVITPTDLDPARQKLKLFLGELLREVNEGVDLMNTTYNLINQ